MRRLNFISIVSIILALQAGLIKPSLSQDPERPICTDSAAQYDPVIWGDWILWEDRRSGGVEDIYMYDLRDSTETAITSAPSVQQCHIAISGSLAVWQDNRNGDWDIYGYYITNPGAGTFPIVDYPEDQVSPALCDSFLAWVDYRGGEFSANIYLRNLNTGEEKQITTDEDGQQSDPAISGHLLVWTDLRNGNQDIYMYNIYTGEEKPICTDPHEQRNPTISGRRIFWEDDRNGNWDIYMCYPNWFPELDLEWPLTAWWERDMPNPPDQLNPKIVGDHLVFQDDRNGNWDIYMYSFYGLIAGTLTPICTADKAQINPDVFGDRVVWQDERNWDGVSSYNGDIYMWERSEGADLAISMTYSPELIKAGSFLTYTIDIVNNGPLDATGVTLTDSLPESVDFLSVSSTRGICSQSGREVTCNIDSLASGDRVTVTIVVHATQEGRITNKAWVTGNEIDRVPGNNTAILQIRVRLFIPTTIDQGYSPSIAVDDLGHAHIAYVTDAWGGDLMYATNVHGLWETQVINNSGDLQHPAIALDRERKVHIAYAQGDGFENQLKYTNNVSGSWAPGTTLVDSAHECASICIGLDSANNVHISYMESSWGGYLIYLSSETGWRRLGIYPNAYSSSSMAVDRDGHVHLCFYGLTAWGGPGYVTNAPDGIWQPSDTIETNWRGGQMEGMVIDIAADRLSNPHISYVGSFNPPTSHEDHKYATRYGGLWQITNLDYGDFMSGCNSIAVDQNNNPHICYYHIPSEEIRYTTNVSGAWEIRYVDNDVWEWETDNNDIAVDTAGKVHICYEKGGEIKYATNAEYTSHYGGGEDGTGGYYFANSTSGASEAPSQPTYEWIDPIASGHTEITAWSHGDGDNGYFGPVDIGFNFPYFDNVYTEVYIGSNGYLSFAYGFDSTASDAYIPSVFTPNNMIAGCAMDLDLSSATYPDAHVYYGGTVNQFIVTYLHAHDQGSATDYITFQIILYSNGNIKIQFNDTETTDPFPPSIANDALVGIENLSGMEGLQYRNNGAGGPLFGSPLAVMFGFNYTLLPVEEEIMVHRPHSFILFQNYPNPFNPATVIQYVLPEACHVKVEIYNALGQKVVTLVDDDQKAGYKSICWDSRDQSGNKVASGVYFYRLEVHADRRTRVQDFVQTKKMVLIR